MDFSPSRRARLKSDIYSTVVIHNSSSDSDENPSTVRRHADDDEEDSSSLPPLLQRLPKDFGIAPDDDNDNNNSHFSSGTVVFRPNRSSLPRRPTNPPFSDLGRSVARRAPLEEDPYSTFLVRSTVRSKSTVRSPRESVSGTVIRRTGGGSSFRSGSASEFRFWEGRRDAAAEETSQQQQHQHQQQQQPRKISVGSIPDSVTKEDPSTKYELLNELGELKD